MENKDNGVHSFTGAMDVKLKTERMACYELDFNLFSNIHKILEHRSHSAKHLLKQMPGSEHYEKTKQNIEYFDTQIKSLLNL